MMNVNVNRTHKDLVFRMIFCEKTELLSLYNAINGSCYDNPDELIHYVLEDAMYIGMKNDVGFLIGDTMNLYEAQSSWNPNMPLRGVFYFSTILQQYVELNHLNIYSYAKLRLPTPRFIVLYNGNKQIEDRTYLRLSDLFIHNEEEPALECVATVLNINYGHNTKLMSACRKLYEYSYLVKEIRIGQDLGLTIEAAIARAIDHCIENGILEELLRKERAKVTKSLLGQYGFDLHIKSEKKLSYDEGHQAGLEAGFEAGLETGHEKGQTETKRQIVKNMLSEHLTDDQISKYTGCSLELINSVRQELNNHL